MRCGSVPLGAASCTMPSAKPAIAAKAWNWVAAGASKSGARLMGALRLDLSLRDDAAVHVVLPLDEVGEIRAAGRRGKKPLGDELRATLGRPQGHLESGGKPGGRVRRGFCWCQH